MAKIIKHFENHSSLDQVVYDNHREPHCVPPFHIYVEQAGEEGTSSLGEITIRKMNSAEKLSGEAAQRRVEEREKAEREAALMTGDAVCTRADPEAQVESLEGNQGCKIKRC